MNVRTTFRRTISRLLPTLCCWSALGAAALAQGRKMLPPPEEPKEASWVFAYALVVLGVGLGLLIVCRPSWRRERAKPQEYQSKFDPAA